jgi:hypothetical protein
MKLLRQKNFILIMIARLISTLGTTMQSFVLALYVLNITGSATKFASILFIAYLPAIFLSPIAGVFVDKMDKKKILVTLDLISWVIVGLYSALFIINGELSLSMIYILVLVLAIINALYIPAIFSLVPLTIEKDYLVDANSIMSFILSSCTLLAPAISGILYSLFGVGIVLTVNSLSFLISAICALFIKFKKTEAKKTEQLQATIPSEFTEQLSGFWSGFCTDFKEGFLFIKTKQIFVYIIVLPMVMNLTIAGVLEVGIPYMLKQVLFVSNAEFGLLQSVAVTSTLLAPMVFSYICKKKDVLNVLFYVVAAMALTSIISIGLVSSSYIGICPTKYIPFITTMGIASAFYLAETMGSLCLFTLFQRETPENLMGRVGTLLNSCATATTPIGVIIYGIMFDHLSPSICLGITSIIVLGFMLYSKNVLLTRTNQVEELTETP